MFPVDGCAELCWAGIVRHGARNWGCVNYAYRDIPSGEWSFFFTFPALIMFDPIFRRYYGAIVPSLFSIIHGFGFCIMNSILGGQVLGSLAPIGER
jgi:hypothetical protein